ncbi:MAG: hypothetical protein KC416_16890, partial [Myxococcales bacterium]|nr:hypothetical protein [Myxococcales bacterium]
YGDTRESPDETRLDVERLPPDAIEVTRDLYAHGLFLEGHLGGRGFVGGIGDVSHGGPWAGVGIGVEVWEWLWLRAAFEVSIHGTDGPSPPSTTVFEMLGALVELRLQLPLSAAVALWLGGEVGAHLLLSDVLESYGFVGSDELGPMYGGNLGVDWHFESRHLSAGLLGGARIYPELQGPRATATLGIQGALYLRYVF